MIKKFKFLTTALVILAFPGISFAQAPTLGSAGNFVLFTTTGAVTNTGTSQFTGDVGTNNGAISGFGNVNGNMHTANGATAAAAADLQTAYNQLDALIATPYPGVLLGNGATVNAGIYEVNGNATLSGVLNLDGQNLPNQVFIIRVNGTLSSAANAQVVLLNGAEACNVYWQIEGLVSLASNTKMRGTLVVNNAAIQISSNVRLEGRALSTTGAITTLNTLGYIPTGCGSPVLNGPAAPVLGSVACFALFTANGPLTNAGPSIVTGDVGTNVGLTTGFNPLLVNGDVHEIPNGTTAAAATDLGNAYTTLNATMHDIELLYPAQFGNSLVLTPHTYLLNGATALTDTLYLNAKGNANAVFVIKINGALSTSTFAVVQLMNGAQATNVFWKVEGAVDISDFSKMAGTIIANNGAVSLNTGVAVDGRALTTNGAFLTEAVNVQIPAPCNVAPIANSVIYKQTFVLGSTNLAGSATVTAEVSPLPEGSPEAGAGITIARERNGSADVLDMNEAGYVSGLGSDSQFRLAAAGNDINKLGVHTITSGGTPGHFYTAFTVKTVLGPGGSFKFLTGTGSNFVNGNQLPTAVQTATSIQIFRHPTAGDLRFGFVNGTSSTTIASTGIDFTKALRVEVYANNTTTAASYFHCGMQPIPANTQHFYFNGVKLTTAVHPTGDFGLSNLADGTTIDALNFISNTAGSDSRIDDIYYSGDFSDPGQLSGTYTVDPSQSMSYIYSDLNVAKADLLCRGMSGPVTLSVVQGRMLLGPFALDVLPQPLTIIGMGTGATLNGCSKSGLIHLDGTDNVTISNITFNSTACEGTGIVLVNGNENVTLSDNTINMRAASLSSKSIGISVTAPTGNIAVTGNTISGGYGGIVFENSSFPVSISGNTITGAYSGGIAANNLTASGVQINNNEVGMRVPGRLNGKAISATNLGSGFVIDGNYIYNAGENGLVVNNSNVGSSIRARIINNRIGGGFQSASSATVSAMHLYNVDNLDLIHNSLLVDAGTGGAGARIWQSQNLDMRNNSFVSVDPDLYALLSTETNTYLQNGFDYNYYSSASSARFVYLYGDKTDLAAVKATPQLMNAFNQNSLAGGNPYGANLTAGGALIDNGLFVASVAMDYEGDVRAANSTDIGADEQGNARLMAISTAAGLDAQVYPNPFQSTLSVNLSSAEAGTVQVTLTDLMGREISAQQYAVKAGNHQLAVNVQQSLAQGVYLLKVRQGEASSVFRIVKQ